MTVSQELVTLVMDELLADEDRLHRLFLVRNRVLTIHDVAFLLGRKDPRTVEKWHNEQKHNLRMNVGPEGDLTMTYKEFCAWYEKTYKKPAPKL